MNECIEIELSGTSPPPANDAPFAAGREDFVPDDNDTSAFSDGFVCLDEPWSDADSAGRIDIGRRKGLLAVVSSAILIIISVFAFLFAPSRKNDAATVDDSGGAALSRFASPVGNAEQEMHVESKAAVEAQAERVERHFGTVGADAKGKGGPDVPMPSADLTTHDLFKFLYDDFGFDEFQSTVIMSAHSVAVAQRKNIGFGNLGREDGWVFDANSYILSNRYYTPQLTDRLLWHMEFLDNSQFSDVPNRYQWYIDPSGFGPIMLNVDIALVRNLDGFLVTNKNGVEGLAVCLFHETAEFDEEIEEISGIEMSTFEACPNAKTLGLVEELGKDNAMFLFEFEKVLAKMVVNGYDW